MLRASILIEALNIHLNFSYFFGSKILLTRSIASAI